jgi:hypothetical protein
MQSLPTLDTQCGLVASVPAMQASESLVATVAVVGIVASP